MKAYMQPLKLIRTPNMKKNETKGCCKARNKFSWSTLDVTVVSTHNQEDKISI